ncbi:hypothetical protein WJX81_007402 [Elliptochloris bilobata]|uniref:HTH La-type RNA-binding domain-containing protein n=1 Tax=Elliptochloris bilobata TaxID=381761 RepID=A0AAW1S8B4_9CHLO
MRQVEFYFSDENLPTDAFLMKQLSRSPEGWVPLKVLAKFNRVKALLGGRGSAVTVLAAALATSEALEVSPERARVRRRAPLPKVAPRAALERTIIADNLPDQLSIEAAMELFGRAGKVAMVRICQPGGGPKTTAQLVYGADIAVSNQRHALVEFESSEDAARAVADLTDTSNWRSGLRAVTASIANGHKRGAPRMPDGSRGFTMGRGAALAHGAAASPGSGAPVLPAACA